MRSLVYSTAAALWHLRSFRNGAHAVCAGGCLSEPLQRRVWQEPVQKRRMQAIESAVCQGRQLCQLSYKNSNITQQNLKIAFDNSLQLD